MTPNQDRDVQSAFDGRLTAAELRQRLTQAQEAIVKAEGAAEAAKHTAIAYAKREIADMEAMRTCRSLLRGLPASKTAGQIDEILAAALGEK